MKDKLVVHLCVGTTNGRTVKYRKRDLAHAFTDAEWYVEQSKNEASRYWFGCHPYVQTHVETSYEVYELDTARKLLTEGGR